MDVSQVVVSAISATGGGLTAAVIVAARSESWYRRADRLAARSDIALPEPFAGRVARFLRRQHLVLAFFGCLPTALMTAVLGVIFDEPPPGRSGFPRSSPRFRRSALS